MNDVFLTPRNCELANHADDSTVYLFDKNIDYIMTSLNQEFAVLSNCFQKNVLSLNPPDKCSFVLYGLNDELETDVSSDNVTIEKKNQEEKVLGVVIDSKLDFMHFISFTKNVNIELNALYRVQK